MEPEAERAAVHDFEDFSDLFQRRRDLGDPRQQQALLKVVERLVLPRLALQTPALRRPDRFGDDLSEEVHGLTDLALSSETSRSQNVLRRLHASGATFRDLQLGLLVPAARRLGGLWLEDAVSFFDVSLATGNLQHMMRFVAIDLDPSSLRPVDRTIVVAPVPGDQHSFGAAMAAEFFRRDGWTVHLEPDPTEEALVDLVGGQWVDVVGLSVAAQRDPGRLKGIIAKIRAAAWNPQLLVIAGGEGLAKNPHLITEIGADAGIAALDVAPRQAHRLVDALFGSRRPKTG